MQLSCIVDDPVNNGEFFFLDRSNTCFRSITDENM